MEGTGAFFAQSAPPASQQPPTQEKRCDLCAKLPPPSNLRPVMVIAKALAPGEKAQTWTDYDDEEFKKKTLVTHDISSFPFNDSSEVCKQIERISKQREVRTVEIRFPRNSLTQDAMEEQWGFTGERLTTCFQKTHKSAILLLTGCNSEKSPYSIAAEVAHKTQRTVVVSQSKTYPHEHFEAFDPKPPRDLSIVNPPPSKNLRKEQLIPRYKRPVMIIAQAVRPGETEQMRLSHDKRFKTEAMKVYDISFVVFRDPAKICEEVKRVSESGSIVHAVVIRTHGNPEEITATDKSWNLATTKQATLAACFRKTHESAVFVLGGCSTGEGPFPIAAHLANAVGQNRTVYAAKTTTLTAGYFNIDQHGPPLKVSIIVPRKPHEDLTRKFTPLAHPVNGTKILELMRQTRIMLENRKLLEAAAEAGNATYVQELLKSKLTSRTARGKALEKAAMGGHLSIAKSLVEKGIWMADFWPAQAEAGRRGHHNVVEYLLRIEIAIRRQWEECFDPAKIPVQRKCPPKSQQFSAYEDVFMWGRQRPE